MFNALGLLSSPHFILKEDTYGSGRIIQRLGTYFDSNHPSATLKLPDFGQVPQMIHCKALKTDCHIVDAQ